MATSKESTTTTTTPPPAIGKIGPYTVFLTPPSTPTTTTTSSAPTTNAPPPPVKPPPAQFDSSSSDRLSFLWHALSKVQHVHASVDEFMANWLGLNQSKFQWALNDYYEAQELEKGDVVTKEISRKSQTV